MKPILFKLAKTPFFGRFMVRWENPLPADELNQWNSFSVKSNSGGLIKGLWLPARSEAAGSIVLGHPMGKEAKGYFLKHGYGQLYQECGLNVFVFDFNGFGESTHGNFSYFEDILAVGHFAVQQFPSVPLFYHGISMGGQWSTITFTQNHAYDYAMLESIPTTLDEFWIRFPLPYRFLKLLYLMMPRYSKKVRMIDRISELKRIKSLLLIYSENDVYTPVSMGARFKAKSNVLTELWTVDDADHAKIIKSKHRKEYENKLKDFISNCLKPKG
ncbi:alpha/beta hydrolase [Chryseolinea sp. H1M3-3]|uniref:alpha/beta hydrolase n=1 Tax=Chryseolinea sp. H1M3-3 TaxID=3034144 RepID=UPI0023EAEF98|nr:alpha/beta hydrolase [Chryseolinea sp. H1M3-3]